MKDFQEELKKIGSVKPSKSFRKEAKLRLLNKISQEDKSEAWFSNFVKSVIMPLPSSSLKLSFLEKLMGKEIEEKEKKGFFDFLFSPRLFATVSAFSVVVVTGFSFMILSSPTSAEEKTFISNFSGIVEYASDSQSDFSDAEIGQILNSDSLVRTGNDSIAEIVFFEDSVLRLDENTELQVKKLAPNLLVREVGTVVVKVNFGRVWVKSFTDNSEYSSFEVHSGDLVVFPKKGVFDLKREGNVNTVRVFERSVKISNRGENDRITFNLIAGNKNTISLRGVLDKEKIDEFEQNDEWVKANIAADELHIDSFFERKANRLKEGQTWENIVLSLKPDSAEKFLALSEKSFHEAVALLEEGETNLANEKLNDSFNLLSKSIEMDPGIKEMAKLTLQNESKYFQFALPQNHLYAAKETLEKQRELIADDPEAIKEEIANETLWEAHELAASKDPIDKNLAEAHLKTFAEEMKSTPTNTNDPVVRADILEKKSEELEVLTNLQERVALSDATVDEVETEVIDDVIEVTKKESNTELSFANYREKSTVQELAGRVFKYESHRGQENTTRVILNDIENDASNLKILRKLKAELPENVQGMVTDKMKQIIDEERKQAVIEGN